MVGAGQRALITGASRGIGREVARTLASEGWQVLSAVRDPTSALPGTEAELVDMGDSESIEALAERLRARNQPLDALVNNAGIYKGPARRDGDERSRRARRPASEPGQTSVQSSAVTD